MRRIGWITHTTMSIWNDEMIQHYIQHLQEWLPFPFPVGTTFYGKMTLRIQAFFFTTWTGGCAHMPAITHLSHRTAKNLTREMVTRTSSFFPAWEVNCAAAWWRALNAIGFLIWGEIKKKKTIAAKRGSRAIERRIQGRELRITFSHSVPNRSRILNF